VKLMHARMEMRGRALPKQLADGSRGAG